MKTLADLIAETDPAKIEGLFINGPGQLFICERCNFAYTADGMQLVLGRVNCTDMAACMRRRVPDMPPLGGSPIILSEVGSGTGCSAALW